MNRLLRASRALLIAAFLSASLPSAFLFGQSGGSAPQLLEPPAITDDSWQRLEVAGQMMSLALPPDMKGYGDSGVFHFYSGADPKDPGITVLAGDALATNSPGDDLASFRAKLAERLAGADWKVGLTMYLRARLDSVKLKSRSGLFFFERDGFYAVFLRSDPAKGRFALIAVSWCAEDKKASEFILGIPEGDSKSLQKALAILGSMLRSQASATPDPE